MCLLLTKPDESGVETVNDVMFLTITNLSTKIGVSSSIASPAWYGKSALLPAQWSFQYAGVTFMKTNKFY